MQYLRNAKTGDIHQLGDEGRSLAEECNIEAIPEASRQTLTREEAEWPGRNRCGHCCNDDAQGDMQKEANEP